MLSNMEGKKGFSFLFPDEGKEVGSRDPNEQTLCFMRLKNLNYLTNDNQCDQCLLLQKDN